MGTLKLYNRILITNALIVTFAHFFKVKTNVRKCIQIFKLMLCTDVNNIWCFLYFRVLTKSCKLSLLSPSSVCRKFFKSFEFPKHLSCNLLYPFLQLRFVCEIFENIKFVHNVTSAQFHVKS